MTPAARRWVVAAMLTSTFMAAAEVTIISTAMPTIVARLGGFNLFTWAFGVYLLGQAVTTPIYGRLADLYGRRVVYLGSTALFLLASLLCGLAWSMPALIVFRGLQGIGGGGLVPLATTIISDVASPADRTRQLSYISGIWGIAAIVGPLLGSLCVGTVGWPFVFWLNLPVGAFTIALVARHLKEPLARQAGGKIDAVGAALLTVGIGAGMAALIQSDTLPTAAMAVLWAAAILCLALFAARERRAVQPMLAAHLLRHKVILAANTSGVVCGALIIGVTAFLPAWVQGVLGDSSLAAGFVLGLLTVSWTGTSMSLGRLRRLPVRLVAVAGAVALAVGGVALLTLPHGGWATLLPACVALGVGLGSSSFVFTVAIQSTVSQGDRGRATSLFYFCRLIGQAVGAAAFGGILNAGLAAGGADAHGALRALMDPAQRMLLPLAELGRLTTVLAGALHGVFGAMLVLTLLSLPVALIVPRPR